MCLEPERRSPLRAVAVAIAVPGLLASAAGAEAQAAPPPPPSPGVTDTVTVAPGPQYRSGALARDLLGDGWRDLWVTPVDAPVFDMGAFAGGVEWERRGGGHQSITLHLVEEDGWQEYIFRSVDKFPVMQAWPAEVRGTPAGRLVQDNQVSTLFPAAPLLVPPLLDAIDALHVAPELYVMPDDPRLEIYRDTFAGMLGTVEAKTNEAPGDEPGFAGSRKIKGTEQFFNDIVESHEHRLDEREFLAVRLIDFLVNDSDRTSDNFRWARFGEGGDYRWRPIPRDRDRAFMHAGGWLNRFLVRPIYPKMIEFGPGYSLEGLTFSSHGLDRRLLQRLTRSDFEEVAQRVEGAIDDEVIEAVVARLPRRWRARTGAAERLREVLRARRSRLGDIALAFYRDLAGEVDIHGTGENERADILRHGDGRVTVVLTGSEASEGVEIARHDDGRVTLTLSGPGEPGSDGPAAFYRRTFLPAETNEVRLYLGAGDDVAVVRGAASNAITVRVVGGPGADMLVDSAGGGATHFYDSEGDDRFVTSSGTRVSTRPWDAPEPVSGLRLGSAWSPDWGGSSGWSPSIGYGEGHGVIVGYGPRARRYGFRRLPYHWQADAKLLLAPGSGRLGVTADLDHRAESSPLAVAVAVRASQLEAFRFFGYGNDTPSVGRDLSLVEQTRIAVEPALVWHIGWRSREGLRDPLRDARNEGSAVREVRPLVGGLEVGPVLYWTDPEPEAGSPAATTAAPGLAPFGRVGFRVGLDLDRTDDDHVPTRGWRLRAGLDGYPPVWDVEESFSTAAAVGSAYLPLGGGGPHVALRAGGALASGAFPVQQAPALGGRSTLRGYRWQRYMGDASAHASTELRVPTGSATLFLRWRMGVFGFADVGRVWFEGESDGGWHTGLGGGVWLSALGRALSVSYAHGEGHRIYAQTGLSF